MRDGLKRRLCKTFGLATLNATLWLFPTQAQAQVVGFLDRAFVIDRDKLVDAGPWHTVAHVEHAGKPIAHPARRYDLESGDRVIVDRPKHIVFVHKFADNALVPVRAGTPWEAQSGLLRALPAAALAWIEDQISGVDQSRIASNGLATLGTRTARPGSAAACFNIDDTEQPTSFAMPIFFAPQSLVTAGRTELLVPWTGGVVPFKIRLVNAQSGALVAEQSDLRDGCMARLRMAPLQAGHYRVALTDAKGSVIEEGNLLVGGEVPPIPAPLKDAPLSELDRQIYYANWLSAVDEGKWAFEALQRVAAMDCHKPAVRQWLSHWGEFISCGG